jgi:hypothetical protein
MNTKTIRFVFECVTRPNNYPAAKTPDMADRSGAGFIGIFARDGCRWLNDVPESVPGQGGVRQG